MQRRIQISQGLLIDVPYHLLYLYMHNVAYKKIRSYQLTYLSTSITFSIHIAAYKKQRAS
jgi:hypothetical protein